MSTPHRFSPSTSLVAGAAAGYLAGSVSFSRLVGARAAPGEDLGVTLIEVPETGTTVEFHGITPTSVKEHAGTRAMMASIALEAAKAAVPTLAARALLPGTPAAPAAAAGAVIGHIFPMWSGWRGGYGMSPMIGGFLVLDPAGLVITTAGLSSVILASHDRRLMMLWPVTVPLWGAARGRGDLLAFGVVANAAYWARLVPELRRGLRSILGTRRPVARGAAPGPASGPASDGASGGFDVAPAEGGGSRGSQQDPEDHERGG